MPSFSLAMSRMRPLLGGLGDFDVGLRDLMLRGGHGMIRQVKRDGIGCHAGWRVSRWQCVADADKRGMTNHVNRAPVARLADLAHSPAPTFGAVGGCTRVTLKRPSAQTTVKPSASTATISPILPAMPFGSFAGSGLASKIFSCLAVERGPGAGRRIAAADQPVDLLPRLAPVDAAHCRGRSGLRRSPSLRPA